MENLSFKQRCVKRFNAPSIKRENRVDIVTEQYVDTNTQRVLYRSAKRVVNQVNEMRKYRPSDFAIENLIASGSLQNLKPVELSGSVEQSLDNITNQLNHLSKEL